MKLSLVIPAYNESERIKPTLIEYLDYFQKDFELIVMIEGADNTLNIVKEFAKKDRRIRYFYSEKRLGKGGAITKGFRLATGDFIGFVDADGSTKPEAFNQLVVALTSYDGAIASRKISGAKLIRTEPLLQRTGSRGFNTLVRILFFLPFKDTQCGAKVFRKSVIDAVLPELGLTEWAFDIDLLFKVKRKGFKIKEIPTVWEHKTGGKFDFNRKFAKQTICMFLSIIRLRALYSPFRNLIKIYDLLFGKQANKKLR